MASARSNTEAQETTPSSGNTGLNLQANPTDSQVITLQNIPTSELSTPTLSSMSQQSPPFSGLSSSSPRYLHTRLYPPHSSSSIPSLTLSLPATISSASAASSDTSSIPSSSRFAFRLSSPHSSHNQHTSSVLMSSNHNRTNTNSSPSLQDPHNSEEQPPSSPLLSPYQQLLSIRSRSPRDDASQILSTPPHSPVLSQGRAKKTREAHQEEAEGKMSKASVTSSAKKISESWSKFKKLSKSARKENDSMIYLDGPRIYTCGQCRTHLTSHDEIISKSFHGRHGRAYLFDQCVNITIGKAEDRRLITGLHSVCDIFCKRCKSLIGWTYAKAYEPSQKYKEGKFIIEKINLHMEESDCYEVNFPAGERRDRWRIRSMSWGSECSAQPKSPRCRSDSSTIYEYRPRTASWNFSPQSSSRSLSFGGNSVDDTTSHSPNLGLLPPAPPDL